MDAQEWQDGEYDQQGNLLDPIKVKEGQREDIDWVLKQKLFDCVLQSECMERQDRPSSLKWVLKNKGEKVGARLVVREINKAKSEDEKLEPSDLFSAMPPVESLKALVSHVMPERVDRRGRNLVLAVFDVSRAHFHGVCERDVHVEPPSELQTSWTRSQTQQDDVRDAGCEQCVGETVERTPPAAVVLSSLQAI